MNPNDVAADMSVALPGELYNDDVVEPLEVYDDFGAPMDKDEILRQDPDYYRWLEARDREARFNMENDQALDFDRENPVIAMTLISNKGKCK